MRLPSLHLWLLLILCVLAATLADAADPAATAADEPSVQQTLEALLAQLRTETGSGAPRELPIDPTSASPAIQSLSNQLVTRIFQQRNATGRGNLPSLQQLNQWLMDNNGPNSFQLVEPSSSDEPTTTATIAAAAATPFPASSAWSNASAGAAAGSVPAPRRTSSRAIIPSTPATSMFGPSGAPTGSTFPSFTAAGASASNGPFIPGPPIGAFGPLDYRTYDDELDDATRRVRYGVYQTAYGWIRYAAYQIRVLADVAALVGQSNVSALLTGIGEQVNSVAFIVLTSDQQMRITYLRACNNRACLSGADLTDL
jgi:hypothetical protein